MENNKVQGKDIVRLIDDILSRAVQRGASDIHFEPTAGELIVKYRIDGVLNTAERLPKYISDNVIARLKVLGGLLTYRSDIPQEGGISGTEESGPAGKVTDKRLAVFPTIHGQRAVVRIFYENTSLGSIEHLGFSDYIYSALVKFCGANQGILLLTGPAGSGKSTTLAAMLGHIQQRFPGKSIVALEDPVERHLQGVTQVQIPPAGDMTFAVALRSLLRQDPEVLMIGEIRDSETARIAVEAGLTGHLLMSTMHSGSCSGALLRLLEMGVEPYQITSSVSAILNQRLVRRLCLKCRKKNESTGFFESAGCPECFHTGFKGRILIAELVELDSSVRKAVLSGADLEQMENILQRRGNMNIMHDAMRIVGQGITTKDEVSKVCGIVE